MKNEVDGVILKKFVGLRPKMYLHVADDDKVEKGKIY